MSKATLFAPLLTLSTRAWAQSPPPLPQKQAPAVERNLHAFDALDFEVFGSREWNRFRESHAQDVIVTWPDGHETRGLERHLEDMKNLVAFAPDIKIEAHPIRFGSGDWTAVEGVMSGTFTQPMATPDGESIAPTGKHFTVRMVTVGHWQNGTMDHEGSLMYDQSDKHENGSRQ